MHIRRIRRDVGKCLQNLASLIGRQFQTAKAIAGCLRIEQGREFEITELLAAGFKTVAGPTGSENDADMRFHAGTIAEETRILHTTFGWTLRQTRL